MTNFVRLTPHGLGQLEDWGSMPSAELIAGTGQQYGFLWQDDAVTGLMVGVWACSPMTGRMGPWSTNEVMILLDGAVTIDHEDGSQLAVTAGEAFFIPKGTVCSWRQEGDVKKFFAIHNDASGLTAENPRALRARKIDTAAVLDALKSGHIGSLALDVYEEEGDLFFEDRSDEILDDDNFARLLTYPNVLITAHQAFLTHEALGAIAETTLANVVAVRAGEACANSVSAS